MQITVVFQYQCPASRPSRKGQSIIAQPLPGAKPPSDSVPKWVERWREGGFHKEGLSGHPMGGCSARSSHSPCIVHTIDRGRAFVQSLRELANRSAWAWRRCPCCNCTDAHKCGTYSYLSWHFEGLKSS